MSSASPTLVTFVGIGAIGLPMAEQLHRSGFEVTGVDPAPRQREEATKRGLRTEPVPTSAADADIVVCMVANAEQLRSTFLGEDGVLRRMREGSVLIVMSTVGPEAVVEVADMASSAVRVLDVPVSGGVTRALTGELSLFTSGAPAALEDARPVLEALGNIIDCGPEVGQGQAYKVVNQLLCSVHIVAAAEALALGEEMGLDLEKLLPAVASGAAGSWILTDRGPRMLQDLDTEVTTTIGQFVKDSTLVKDTADNMGFDAPLITAAQAKYLAAKESGWELKDDSQMIQTYRQQ